MTTFADNDSAIQFDALALDHHLRVGGKCASLGTMSQAGLPVPPGFAVTTDVFVDAREASGLMAQISEIVAGVDTDDQTALSAAALKARNLILSWPIAEEHERCIRGKYADLCLLSDLEDVPGGAGARVDQGAGAAEQRVEQRRLAGVDGADQGDPGAVDPPPGRSGGGDQALAAGDHQGEAG